MTDQILVSVIIPTYNRAHLLGETLDSIIAQNYRKWECLVIDDGSTDYTEELLEFYCAKDPRIQCFCRPDDRPKGANACRNYGFELSSGQFINWFDSDDLLHPEKLLIQIKELEKTGHNFSICQTLMFENHVGNLLGLRHDKIKSEYTLEDYIAAEIFWLTQAPLWRRDFLLKMNKLFDEDLQAAQEWEFHCRCLFYSPEYHVTDRPLVYLRVHKESISFKNDNGLREANYYLAREKVFEFLRKKGVFSCFLSEYFLIRFRKKVVQRSIGEAFSILKRRILVDENFSSSFKTKMWLAFFSYSSLGKGERFFKSKKYRAGKCK